MDDPLNPHQLRTDHKEDEMALVREDEKALVGGGAHSFSELWSGRIVLRLLGDPLTLGQQISNKAGGPLRIVPGDVITDLPQVDHGLGGELTAQQRVRPARPSSDSGPAARRLPLELACRGRC